jgi:putative endonuclease
MRRHYYVYIMTNEHNTVLYTGMTNDLKRRAYEHRTGRGGGFTSRFRTNKLVYYEITESAETAITREKKIASVAPLIPNDDSAATVLGLPAVVA